MKRASLPCSSSTDEEKMPPTDLLLSALFQVIFDKLISGLIFFCAHWDKIHVKLKNWSQSLSSIQGQIQDDAGETQWLRRAVDLACEVIDLLDEMALSPGSEDLKETTRKILTYESLPSIGSTYGTQEEEDNIQLPPLHEGKSRKWKKKNRPRKLCHRKSIKWNNKHPPENKKDVRTRNRLVEDIAGPSTVTKESHDQLIYSLVDHLASHIAAWMSQRKTDMELYEEKAPTQTHYHLHKEQSSPMYKGKSVKTSAELNTEPRTCATLDSVLVKITEQQTYMDKRLVELEKMLHQVLNCIEKQDASPLCAKDSKRRCSPKLPPAKRLKTQGSEVAKYSYTLPVCNVPSSPVSTPQAALLPCSCVPFYCDRKYLTSL